MPQLLGQPQRHPVLVEHEVEIDDLDPRHEGLRIAHLSDVHVGRLTPAAHVRRAVEVANEARPDLIVMTGDYVCSSRKEIPLMKEQLAGLQAQRVMVALGNHDYYASGSGVAQALAENGYDVLRNQHSTLSIGGAPLHVIGLDDPVTRQHDIHKSFASVPKGGTRVALSHCPELVDALSRHGAQLVLSGHTHGGQVFVKGITDVIAQRMGRRYLSGHYQAHRCALYVTAGIGYSGVSVRSGEGTAAEVALLTLRRRK